MRKDTSFSNKKLTTEEFSKKYWKGGKMPYQYHTGTIEDGRDEREQFVFNNVRALWERLKVEKRNARSEKYRMWKIVLDNERKIEKLTFIVNMSLALIIIRALWNKRS